MENRLKNYLRNAGGDFLATLYEMSEQAQYLYTLLENDEIDQQTLEDTLESIGANEKLENYIYIQKQLENDLTVLKNERDRIDKKIKACSNNIEKMKSAILMFMLSAGIKKTKAGTFDLSISTTEKIHVTDEKKIPKEFFIEQRPKINLLSLKKLLKNGDKIPGAELERTEYVRVR